MDKILVADENEQTVDLIGKILFNSDYEIYTAYSGKVALTKIEMIKPDLIIINTDFSDMSGFDICKKLKANSETNCIPILMLAAVITKDIGLRCVYSGVDDYISKVFDGTIFIAKVKSLLRVKHLSDRIKTQYEELKEKNEVIDFQLKMARRVQRSIIRKLDMTVSGTKILSKYLPALEVGGDFYSVKELDSSHIGLIIGDVSGHGISAALLTATLSMMFDTMASVHKMPDSLLKEMNNQFCKIFKHTGNEMYVCMFYAIVDTVNFVITYSNAGQVYPVFVDNKNESMLELELGGIPIGLMSESSYEVKETKYSPGDYLFFHTDGLSDFFYKREPDKFGEKIKECLKDNINRHGEDLESIIEGVLNEFYDYDEKNKFEKDDISIILCKL
ncbi:MAG: SpoIIE family protein phosphatase [Clostridiales bacterium]|nr:SpoIIE family protein phosphatase [Clostridiales bacterium]